MHWQTQDSVTKQLRAMGCAEYELGVMDEKGFYDEATKQYQTRMHLRPRPARKEPGQTTSELPPTGGITDAEIQTKYLSWLGRMNANGGAAGNGCHVFIRPFGPTNLSFIDDLKRPVVDQMTKDGFQFAVLIESSPNNFHGWLKHNEVLAPEEETVAAQMLCERYGGDPGAASKRRFGRLAGFTNRKEKYRDDSLDRTGTGGFPFVRIHDASGRVFDQSETFLTQVREKIKQTDQELQRKGQQAKELQHQSLYKPDRVKDITYFQQKLPQKGERYTADFQYALHALQHGKSALEVEHVIKHQSNSGSNKGNYPQRTVENAYKFLGKKGTTLHVQQDLGR